MKKFKIPTTPSSSNKTIRFPDTVIRDVEKAIEGKNCSFTAFVVEAVKVAVKSLEGKEK